MKNKKCPQRKFCLDYANNNCDDCAVGDEMLKLHKCIDRLKKQNETLAIQRNWISVEDRLPERIGKYLVFTVDRRIYICNFINHYCHGNAQFDDYKVTHWMPLPEAPKGGAE